MGHKLLLVCIGLLVFCLAAGAQGIQPEKEIVISAVFDRGSDEESPGLDGIFLDSLGIELELAGFELSNNTEPLILIRIVYTVSEAKIQFSLSAEVFEDGKILYRRSSREELSFELDTVLLGHARNIASLIKEYVEETEPEILEATVPEMVEEVVAEIFEEPRPELIEETKNDGNEAGPSQPVILDEPKEQETDLAAEATTDDGPREDRVPSSGLAPLSIEPGHPWKSSGLAMEADLGLFLAAGEPGRYFKGGYSLAALMGYRFPYTSGTILGVSVGMMYFMVDGFSAEAQGWVVTFGPGLRLKADDTSSIAPGFKINVGAALFMISPEVGELRTKVIPAAECAMTVDILLDKMALQVLMGVKLFYEDSSILYGFAPGIGIEF